MPVVGSGMLAKAFLRESLGGFKENIIYCSGVSNSACSSAKEFERERLLLLEMLARSACSGQPLVYFGTCAMFDSLSCSSPYVLHKKALEDLVTNYSQDNIVIRLPQVVAPEANVKQLIPFLVNAIENHQKLDLMTVDRNLVFVDDVVHFCNNLILSKWGSGGVYNFAAKFNVSMIELIQHISKRLNLTAFYELRVVEQNLDIPVSQLAFEYVADLGEVMYWKNALDRVL